MSPAHHEETFSFRFTQLSETEVQRLRANYPLIEIEVRQWKDNEHHFVAAIDLAEDLDLEPLYGFIEATSAKPEDYSVWISLRTSSDHDGLSLPPYVLELIRRIKVRIDFSFVVI